MQYNSRTISRKFENTEETMIPNYTINPTYHYIPALDGFRAIAILLVVLGHFGFGHFVPGGFGVTLFFFVSGFLITRLLLAEFTEQGNISLPHFYMRRILRLYPALLFMILLSVISFHYTTSRHIDLLEITSALFYFANYYGIYVGYTFLEGTHHPFSILWSLAVEEHYYLFFPFMFLLFSEKKLRFLKMIATMIILIMLWRILLVVVWEVSENRTYYATDTRADSILYGCLLSTILTTQYANKFVAICAKPMLFYTALGILVLCLLIRNPLFRETIRYSLQGIALLLIFPAILFTSRYEFLKQLLQYRWIVYIGKLSYSLYLQHWLVISLVGHYSIVTYSAQWYIVVIPTTLVLVLISYHLIEKPLLSLRRHYGSHRNLANI
jgi:peptidoglycan/LPS O-acetylase OafA/YrhL